MKNDKLYDESCSRDIDYMQSIHSSLFQLILLSLFLIFTSIVFAIGFYLIKRNGSPLPRLFHEFDKKMWMTLGLGLIFFGFYFLLVTALSWILNPEKTKKIFLFFYHYKVESIYIGLFVFASIALAIYLTRLFIKFLYTSRMK